MEYKSPNEKILDMAVEIRFKLDELGYPSKYGDVVKSLIEQYAYLPPADVKEEG